MVCMDRMRVSGVDKILVVGESGLKYFVAMLPALQTLKELYPKAELILLGDTWHQDYVAHERTPVDRVLVRPSLHTNPHYRGDDLVLEAMKKFGEQMAAEKIDVVVCFEMLGEATSSLVKLLGAKTTVGIKGPGVQGLDGGMAEMMNQQEACRYWELVRLLGATGGMPLPHIQLLGDDIHEARMVIPEGHPYVVLCPGSEDLRLAWPMQKFVDVGNALSELGLEVVVAGLPGDMEIVKDVADSLDDDPIVVCGTMSLSGLTGLLAMSTVVVGNDIGLLSLAQAAGAKTVGIYWMPQLVQWGPLLRADHRCVVSWDVICPECGLMPIYPHLFELQTDDCGHEVSFIRDIKVEEVVREVERLLSRDE